MAKIKSIDRNTGIDFMEPKSSQDRFWPVVIFTQPIVHQRINFHVQSGLLPTFFTGFPGDTLTAILQAEMPRPTPSRELNSFLPHNCPTLN